MRAAGKLMPLVAALGIMSWGVTAASPASAGTHLANLVSDHASDRMPAIPGGECYHGQTGSCRRVNAIAESGGWVYVAGIISSVTDRTTGTTITGFHNLFRFNATTGAVDTSFKPQFYRSSQSDYTDSIVTGLVANNGALYVAGSFTEYAPSPGAAGVARKGVAAISTTNGSLESFDPHVCEGGGSCVVENVAYTHGTLWLSGDFSKVAGKAQSALAFVNPTTGSLQGSQLGISGRVTSNVPTKVAQAAINPQQTQAVIIGNFATVGGATHKDVAVLNVTSSGGATVNAWNDPVNLNASGTHCHAADTWARGVDWDPTGTYFDIAASGGGGFNAYGQYGALCDAFSRFKSDGNPNTPYPLIVNQTGFDSLFTVQDTGNYVYTGGHNHGLNHGVFINGKQIKATFEHHYGLGVIDVNPSDPGYGLAVSSWNKGSATGRGQGWKGSLTTSAGLYMGGDAAEVNGDKSIERLAFFPAG
jgi:hypothetical protein